MIEGTLDIAPIAAPARAGAVKRLMRHRLAVAALIVLAVLVIGSAGAPWLAPFDPEELDIALGIHRIESLTSLRIRRPRHVWAGLRSFAPDGDFVIGWDPRRPGFFWLAGQGGYGIQTSAGASAAACALLLGRELPEFLARQGVVADRLSPRRFDAGRT